MPRFGFLGAHLCISGSHQVLDNNVCPGILLWVARVIRHFGCTIRTAARSGVLECGAETYAPGRGGGGTTCAWVVGAGAVVGGGAAHAMGRAIAVAHAGSRVGVLLGTGVGVGACATAVAVATACRTSSVRGTGVGVAPVPLLPATATLATPTAATAVAIGGTGRAASPAQSGVAVGSSAEGWIAARGPQPESVSTATVSIVSQCPRCDGFIDASPPTTFREARGFRAQVLQACLCRDERQGFGTMCC
jgi:hypothetical protein